MPKNYKGTRSSLGPGPSDREGVELAGRVMENTKKLYPVSNADVKALKDASQKTTKVKPDGMGKDSTAAIAEFLKNNKE
jgi:hypothetical protein